MFSELIATLENYGKSTHAFSIAADVARTRAANNPESVAAWSLLASIAELFVERYERQALPTAECVRWFDLIRAETDRLDAAFAKSDPAERLNAINQTAKTLVDQEA
ncbi:hypothetical protein [uncultured Paracoccus sp.]|jgi:hypothetical protein|uniref:hypothetical protein n=1 Tax=uncultured Paracoccus sp. TaxID=189685 RepID=UPI00260DAA90|nr:hypothetical protein [uncultured Paracoccus sp.]